MILGATNSPAETLLLRLLPLACRNGQVAALLRRGIRTLSWCVGFAAAAYVVQVVLLIAVFRTAGERFWFLWPALYAPPHLALLPLGALFPLGVLFCPRSLVLDALALFFVLFVYMGLQWAPALPPGPGPTLSVMTCNVGQRRKAPLSPFVDSEKPDIIALQDARHKGPQYARQYPSLHVRSQGEFVLISRFPIRSSAPVGDVLWRRHPVAARFEIDWDGRALALYNVHMPTPRRELERLMGLGFLKEWARSHGWWGTDPDDGVAARLEARPALAEALRDRILAEQVPTIVAGDLNIPHWGYTCKMITARLADAYGERGKGFGFTFPGISRNPVTLFGPWLRLDYLFCTRNLEPQQARVEPAGRAQHRAVVARFALGR